MGEHCGQSRIQAERSGPVSLLGRARRQCNASVSASVSSLELPACRWASRYPRTVVALAPKDHNPIYSVFSGSTVCDIVAKSTLAAAAKRIARKFQLDHREGEKRTPRIEGADSD